MKPRISYIIVSLFLFVSIHLTAQEYDSTQITIDRLFTTSDFRGDYFRSVEWLEDGTGYTALERSETVPGGTDLVAYNAETGEKEILVSAEKFIPQGDTIPVRVSGYEWSPDNDMLLIFTNTARVWRYHTRGDYWALNLESWQFDQLGKDFEPSQLMFAKFSPDEKKIGYVMKHNIYVEDLATHEITQLTTDGSETIINGTFDWVYEEELDLRDGFRWSPDSKKIAYWQLDASGVGEFLLINDTDSIYSYTIPVQYPKVGTTNSAGKVGVISAEGGETQWIDVPGDPRNNYIARMEWANNSDELLIEHLNRLQNKNEVFIADASTGKVKTLFVDEDEAWVDIHDDLYWLEDGGHFTWVSESDGWLHVYVVDKNTGEWQLVTPGDYDVISLESIDEENDCIYFVASPDNPTQRYLYRTNLDGEGDPELISPENDKGTHRYTISPNSEYAIHSYSDINTPSVTEIITLPDHEVLRTVVDNEKLKGVVANLDINPAEFFRVDNGEVVMDGYEIKPPDFDESKKYPVLFYVYNEPAGQTVLDRWSGRNFFWHQMLAQKGYIIMSIDSRGTPAPRGREWRKSVYKQLGKLPSKDHADATKVIIKERPYIDASRIAIWGWSGGGSSSLNAIFRYPGIYNTAMAVAPVSDERYYDTIYQERYMGLPKDDPEAYREASAITYADQLEGNLLMVHGTGDDNVHYQNTEAVVNKLIAANKQFQVMPYPNRTHGIYEGRNTSRHLFTLLTTYLMDKMPPGPVEE